MNVFTIVRAVLEDLWQFVLNGFVYHDSSTGRAGSSFESGRYYSGENFQTARTRLGINNAYSEVEISRPLQASEYVAYMLAKYNKPELFDAKRWTPGEWHQQLKGKPGIHIGVVPMQGTVIEYLDENQDGVVGIVHDVFDDESILYGGVGIDAPGVYEEIVLSREAWHELRPVFISIMN